MGWINLDQATELRKMMYTKQQNSIYSVAFLSMSDILNVDKLIKEFVTFYAKKEKKETALFGIRDKQVKFELSQYLFGNGEIKKGMENPLIISGRLDIFEEIRKTKKLKERFIRFVEMIENESEEVFYYVGSGIHSITVNLSILADTIVLIVKDQHDSIKEAMEFVEILSKLDQTKKVALILDTREESVFKEQSKKIQELSLQKFNYYIEPIGFAEMKYVPVKDKTDLMKQFDLSKIKDKKEKQSLSKLFLRYM